MCGIWGSPVFTEGVRGMLPHLAVAMLSRGTHAWGASNGVDMIHHLGPVIMTWHGEQERIRSWNGGIFHTRAASVGSKEVLANAHPFRAERPDGSYLIGIHNGTLHNHEDLNRDRSRTFNVDSQHIWQQMVEERSLLELRGSANLAWYDSQDLSVIHASRINSQNLHIVRLNDGGVVFCSEQNPLQIAARMAGTFVTTEYNVEEYRHYLLSAGDVRVLEGETSKLRFGTYAAASSVRSSYDDRSVWNSTTHQGAGIPMGGRTAEQCFRCARKKEQKADWLCAYCISDHFAAFQSWKKLHPSTPAAPGLVGDRGGDVRVVGACGGTGVFAAPTPEEEDDNTMYVNGRWAL